MHDLLHIYKRLRRVDGCAPFAGLHFDLRLNEQECQERLVHLAVTGFVELLANICRTRLVIVFLVRARDRCERKEHYNEKVFQPGKLESHAAQRMAAKLRPRVMLPRRVSSTATRAAEARGRQLQRLVGRLTRQYRTAGAQLERPGVGEQQGARCTDRRKESRHQDGSSARAP